jgi:putative ABC transport system permease protein
MNCGGESNFFTYILLRDGANLEDVKNRVPSLMKRQSDSRVHTSSSVFEPLKNIHLYSPRSIEGEYKGDILYVYIFSCMAVLVLVIACFNYMNLATARAMRRSREVGVRKSIGATFWQLATQFYFESALVTTLAFLIALFGMELLLPYAASLIGKDLSLRYAMNSFGLGMLMVAWILAIIVAGSYPAVILSGIQPSEVLATARKARGGAALIRRVLVVA